MYSLAYAQPENAPRSRAAALLDRVLRGRSPWGLADQVLISGTNFVTMVFAARGMGKAGFGQFSNVYNALLLANLIQSALVTQPHNVLGTGRRGRAYAAYTSGAASLQLAIAAVEALLALIFAAIGDARGWECDGLLWAMVPAIVAWQLQEFVRRALYTEGRTGAAFINDILSYGGQALWIVALWGVDTVHHGGAPHHLTGPAAMYVLAATSAAGALLGAWQLRGSFIRRINMAAWRENWRFGKWLLGSEVLTYCSSLPMYMYLAGALIGPAASGDLKAAQTLFGPARVISFYLATVLPIRFAATLARGGGGAPALDAAVRGTARVVLPTLGAFCLLVGALAAPAMLIFGRAFAGSPRVLAMYAVIAFLSYVQMIYAAALVAQRRTRYIFVGSIWGAAITLLLSVPLIKLLGTYGALLGMALTGATVTLLYWSAYRRCIREGVLRCDETDVSAAQLTEAPELVPAGAAA